MKKAVEEKRRALVSNPASTAKSTPNLYNRGSNNIYSPYLRDKQDTVLQNYGSHAVLQQPSNNGTLNYYEKIQTLQSRSTLPPFDVPQLHHAASAFSDTFDANLRSANNAQTVGIPPPIPRHGVQSSAVGINNRGIEFSSVTSDLGGDLNEDELAERKKLAESRSLRLHQQRLEQRSRVLEEHNRQLQQQLVRLKHRLVSEKVCIKTFYFLLLNFFIGKECNHFIKT